jgi:hypothetical protein
MDIGELTLQLERQKATDELGNIAKPELSVTAHRANGEHSMYDMQFIKQ